MTRRHGKIALFIDGPNLQATGKAMGLKIDFRRLLVEFQAMGAVVRAFYYSAIAEENEFLSVRPLLDWLDYNGFAVVTKPMKEFVDAGGGRKTKGNMDVELAVDAMELAGSVDQIVLFSGDSGFLSVGRGASAPRRSGQRRFQHVVQSADDRE